MQMVHTGQLGDYHWLASGCEIWTLPELVLRFHRGLRICITSFDSGSLVLTKEELEQGWTTHRGVSISPPVEATLAIPHDQYDEWYILENPPFPENDIEVFVNYGAFSLVAPTEIYKTFDPTWDKTGLE